MKLEVGQKYRIRRIENVPGFVPVLGALPEGSEVTLVRLNAWDNAKVHTVSNNRYRAIACHEERLIPITPEDLYIDTDF